MLPSTGPALQALSMEGQDMGEDAAIICGAIGRNQSLSRLDLSMTVGISAVAARLICQGCPMWVWAHSLHAEFTPAFFFFIKE